MTDKAPAVPIFTLPSDDPETWQSRIHLPAWEEIGHAIEPRPAPGVTFAFQAKGENPPDLRPDEIGHARWFMAHADEVLEAALRGLFSVYHGLVESFGYDADERARWMPDIVSVEELKHLVKPVEVTIEDVTRDGLPYIGILFECIWDPEHGTGVMMNGTRLVAAGEAEHARDSPLATEDARL